MWAEAEGTAGDKKEHGTRREQQVLQDGTMGEYVSVIVWFWHKRSRSSEAGGIIKDNKGNIFISTLQSVKYFLRPSFSVAKGELNHFILLANKGGEAEWFGYSLTGS